jgi:hypothetical protein
MQLYVTPKPQMLRSKGLNLGFANAYNVAYGRQKTCKGLHFVLTKGGNYECKYKQ